MPSRWIREGILTSERVEQLDAPAEVFYRRLLNRVDDFGLFDARPSILRSALFPLRLDRVREADLQRWIAACVKAGLIVLYEADSKPYLKVLDTRWPERSEPKYPIPTTQQLGVANSWQLPTVANSCQQVLTESKSVSKSKSKSRAGPNAARARPPDVLAVSEFMQTLGLSESEAAKESEAFWDYFSSNGWKVGGKAPMQDWNAAARNWFKRRQDFSTGTQPSQAPLGISMEDLEKKYLKPKK